MTNSKWEKIESAPKNFKDIILYCDQATVPLICAGYWDDGEMWRETGYDSQDQARGWWQNTSSCGSEKLWYEPTHWQPIEPPESEGV